MLALMRMRYSLNHAFSSNMCGMKRLGIGKMKWKNVYEVFLLCLKEFYMLECRGNDMKTLWIFISLPLSFAIHDNLILILTCLVERVIFLVISIAHKVVCLVERMIFLAGN